MATPPPPPPFELEVLRDGATARIAPAGELDIATAPELEQAIDDVTRDGAVDLVLDLRALTFMDSTGLRMLVQTHAQAAERGYELLIWRGSRQIDKLFSVSGLDDLLPLVDAPAGA